jgi:hypothetical protein
MPMTTMETAVKRNFRPLFWVEVGTASITGLLCIITPFWPDWIEALSGWDPDQHDGSVEWMIAGGLLLVTLAIFALARSEMKRTPVAQHT